MPNYKSNDIATQDGKMLFSDGDIFIQDNSKEHAVCLLKSNLGEFKRTPEKGVGITSALNSPETSFNTLRLLVKQQFESDGFAIQDFEFIQNNSTNEVDIKLNAERFR